MQDSKIISKLDAWRKGKNPWVTVTNPNNNETNKRYIKVKANEAWGTPRQRLIING